MSNNIISFLVEPWKMIYSHRNMLLAVFISDLRSRFASGNILGWAWLVLFPLFFLGAYSLLFIGLMSVRLPDMNSTEYILLIFSGFVVWWAVSEVIGNGIALIHSNVGLIRNTLFPIEMLAVRITIVAATQLMISIVLMLIAYAVMGKFSITWIQIPFLLIIQIVLSIGIAWILATLGAFFKDLIQVTSVVLMLMLLLTPIGYPEDMATGKLKLVIMFNPATYLIRAYRDCISLGQWSEIQLIFGLVLGALFVFYVGYYLFSRLKAVFSDVI